MDYTSEFTFRVNETCLTSDHNIFMVAPTDRDAHNPILVHLKPADMVWGERRSYVPFEMKRRCHEKRKEIREKASKRAPCKIGATGLRLVMVFPHPPRPEHGDQSECILL